MSTLGVGLVRGLIRGRVLSETLRMVVNWLPSLALWVVGLALRLRLAQGVRINGLEVNLNIFTDISLGVYLPMVVTDDVKYQVPFGFMHARLGSTFLQFLFNPFPHIDAFRRLCSRRLLKTW